jgi:hypothetical protein
MLKPPVLIVDVNKPAAGYVDLISAVYLDEANGVPAGCSAAAHCGSAGYLAGAHCVGADWPAVSDATNKALFQRVECDTPSFCSESPSLDSWTPLLTPLRFDY